MPDSQLAPSRDQEAHRSPWTPAPALHSGPRLPLPRIRTSLIELRSVRKVFSAGGSPDLPVLSDLDLDLEAGSSTLIEGTSGSGKTTLLGLLGCLVRPTAGRIRVAGIETTRLPEDRLAELRRHRIGFVFQDHHLVRGASALANVMLPALPRPEVDGDLRHRAAGLLRQLRLADRDRTPVERLSGGERQRVAIARALVNGPSIVLADEPTAHLDEEAARSFLALLRGLREAGTTLVVASHDPVLCRSGAFGRRFRLDRGSLREETPRCS